MSRPPDEAPGTSQEWQVVLRSPTQHVVSYHAGSKSLRVATSSFLDDDDVEETLSSDSELCPTCLRPLDRPKRGRRVRKVSPLPSVGSARYFGLLSESHSGTPANSRPPSPGPARRPSAFKPRDDAILTEELATGFYDRFFREERLLGRGARGSVYLVRHHLQDQDLGWYAVKKISVGDSHASLLTTLREIRTLETLRHKNCVAYHHAWLEASAVGRTAPIVPCLFVLLDFCNLGSLTAFIEGRAGVTTTAEADTKDERIRRFKSRRESSADRGAIHHLRLDEIIKLFRDICEGLAFMHSHSVLHLDLNSNNVLLHLEVDELIPRASLSDFGSSEERSKAWRRERSGQSGTPGFVCPEAFKLDAHGRLQKLGVEADLWSLGLLLHQLCFLRLPFRQMDDVDLLQEEIMAYKGFEPRSQHGRRDLPFWMLRLIGQLLSLEPSDRPAVAEVLLQLDRMGPSNDVGTQELVPVLSRPSQEAIAKGTKEEATAPRLGIRAAWLYAAFVMVKFAVLRPMDSSVLFLYHGLSLAEVILCVPAFSVGVTLLEIGAVGWLRLVGSSAL